MAYLVPATRFAQHNDVTVGIATKTNALTDQLVSHELPALNEALPGGVTFCSIKGYDHYP
jgi:ATP-dependent DNA helicase DinG